MIRYIGLGYNCAVTEIMTRGGLRTESLPFDWTSSYPDDIRRSLDVDFADWLDPKYLSIVNNSTSGKIVTAHSKYSSNDRTMELRGKDRIIVFFNHHNLLDPVDRARINRRIHRYREIIKSNDPIVFITNAKIQDIKKAGLDTYYSDRDVKIVYLDHAGYEPDALNVKITDEYILIKYTSPNLHGDGISKMICNQITEIFGGSKDNPINPSIRYNP